MHDSILGFVHRVTRKHGLKSARILEIGSYNVNGSVREFFDGEYLGIDIIEGPGVDLVCSSHNLLPAKIKLGEPQVVVCTEMLEHDDNPWQSMEQIGRSGCEWLILTTRKPEFPYHNPPDRWRFLEDGIRSLVKLAGLEVVELIEDPQVSGWLCLARRCENGK